MAQYQYLSVQKQSALIKLGQILIILIFVKDCQAMQNNQSLRCGKYSLEYSNMIGKGSTGNVYRGVNLETNESVAVKIIQMSQVMGEVPQYLLNGEKKALATIKNQYVLKTYDIIQLPEKCLIVTEFCQKGSLKDYIAKSGKFFNTESIELFRKILIGYMAISEALFIHRDLKSANILLRSNGDPVIIDFGYCEMMMAKKPTLVYNVGSPSYMAPQAHFKSRYSEKSDVWALGIIFYQMLTGKTPDHEFSDIKQYFHTLQAEKAVRMNTGDMFQICKDILNAALQINPENRCTSHKLKYMIDKYLIPQTQSTLNRMLGYQDQDQQSRIKKQTPMTVFKYGPANSELKQKQEQKVHNNFQQSEQNSRVIRQSPSVVSGWAANSNIKQKLSEKYRIQDVLERPNTFTKPPETLFSYGPVEQDKYKQKFKSEQKTININFNTTSQMTTTPQNNLVSNMKLKQNFAESKTPTLMNQNLFKSVRFGAPSTPQLWPTNGNPSIRDWFQSFDKTPRSSLNDNQVSSIQQRPMVTFNHQMSQSRSPMNAPGLRMK